MAFEMKRIDYEHAGPGYPLGTHKDWTAKEHIAVEAMKVILLDQGGSREGWSSREIAPLAFDMAEAMIIEGEKR